MKEASGGGTTFHIGLAGIDDDAEMSHIWSVKNFPLKIGLMPRFKAIQLIGGGSIPFKNSIRACKSRAQFTIMMLI